MCIQINTRCHQARLHDDSQVPRAPQSASSIKSDSSGAREFMSLPSTPGTPGTMSTTRTDYEGLVLASPVTVPERQMFDNTRVRCVWAPTRVATRPKEGMCSACSGTESEADIDGFSMRSRALEPIATVGGEQAQTMI
ncbi:unnamed protein product [Parascedosporium putredinis]|uniref:Uncharacterized protein n=1 Tax=Parascedosporium putredinis TaxID=1442378 RepID=A0A9P1MGG5_9PEZI|nr:unnamed protein product [Parascedosporium putredinis]CAI8004395.1 unnamed protein product [Parascedosporium putredinis]